MGQRFLFFIETHVAKRENLIFYHTMPKKLSQELELPNLDATKLRNLFSRSKDFCRY